MSFRGKRSEAEESREVKLFMLASLTLRMTGIMFAPFCAPLLRGAAEG